VGGVGFRKRRKARLSFLKSSNEGFSKLRGKESRRKKSIAHERQAEGGCASNGRGLTAGKKGAYLAGGEGVKAIFRAEKLQASRYWGDVYIAPKGAQKMQKGGWRVNTSKDEKGNLVGEYRGLTRYLEEVFP